MRDSASANSSHNGGHGPIQIVTTKMPSSVPAPKRSGCNMSWSSTSNNNFKRSSVMRIKAGHHG